MQSANISLTVLYYLLHYSVRVNEGTSNFPFYLWTLNYDDDDLDAKNKHSVYELLRITNGSTSIGNYYSGNYE